MTCLIVEDQPPAQRILRKYIADRGNLDLRGVYPDALAAARHLRSAAQPLDLLFLDINLPKLSGLDFLRSLSTPPAVILTTAYPDYALEGYELNVVDYLLKPFSFARFVQAVEKVSERTAESAGPADHLFIKSGREYLRVRVADILYLRAGSDYTEIITAAKKYLSTDPLREWSERLEVYGHFQQIHRSYLVNTTRVDRIVGNEVALGGRHVLPMGRAYKAEVLRRLGLEG